jgi:DNA repair protein RadC
MTQAMVLKKDTSIQDTEADHIISTAIKCLENRLRYDAHKQFTSSKTVSNFLRLQLGQEADEVFSALFLNNQNQLIAFEKLFYGTIDQATIHPRTVVKKCLEHNAAKIILAHNHPSHHCKPSNADQEITKTLKDILKVIDIQVLDHFVVTPHETYSFVEHCLL